MLPSRSVRPECAVLAGPNGAGKSSLFASLAFPGRFINADDIARELNPLDPESASLQAGRLVVKSIDEVLVRNEDFTYETTLSSHQSLNLLKRAREAGYRTLLIFVALNSADMHVARVAQRVKVGGHHIPEPIIRRRYDLAFDNLAKAVPFCEVVSIYDNSSPAGYRNLLTVEGDKYLGTTSSQRIPSTAASPPVLPPV